MFRILSYFNIFMAVVYLLMFLLNGNLLVIFGILMVIVFSTLVIKMIQSRGRAGLIHYVLGLGSLGFAGFLLFGLVHIIEASIAYHYFSNTLNYMVLTSLFVLSVVVHFILFCFYRAPA
ncbi:hypothetical protein D3C85_1214320 [compost metagenome]